MQWYLNAVRARDALHQETLLQPAGLSARDDPRPIQVPAHIPDPRQVEAPAVQEPRALGAEAQSLSRIESNLSAPVVDDAEEERLSLDCVAQVILSLVTELTDSYLITCRKQGFVIGNDDGEQIRLELLLLAIHVGVRLVFRETTRTDAASHTDRLATPCANALFTGPNAIVPFIRLLDNRSNEYWKCHPDKLAKWFATILGVSLAPPRYRLDLAAIDVARKLQRDVIAASRDRLASLGLSVTGFHVAPDGTEFNWGDLR